MSHAYTYTYVTYLTYMTYTQNICYLYVYTYKLRKPASFLPKRWSGKETGLLSLVYTYRHKAVTYIHRRKLLSLSSYVIYVHVHASVTYMHFYICHLYVCPYVKDTDMRVYVCYTYMVCIDALMHIRHMYTCVRTCVTYMHIYICYPHTCNICYLNTYPTYIYICGPYADRYVTYRHVMHTHV